MKQRILSRTTPLHYLSVFFCTTFLCFSCSSDPEPNELFLGSYTAQKFCNDSELFTSEITPGTLGDQIIWVNAAGREGAVDDLKGTVTGNSIVLLRQSIGDGLFMSATGTLLESGNLELNTTAFAGPISINCFMTFEAE